VSDFRIPAIENPNFVKMFVERLETQIEDLQLELSPNEQLAVRVLLPGGQRLLVQHIGYHNPTLVMLTVLDATGKECTLLAHQNTVQLLCETVPVEADKPRQKIGFQTT
jgi:hypothetical protein